MLNCNGPAKERGRLGFSDFVNALGFNTRGSDEEISMEKVVGEVAMQGDEDGKRTADGASLKEMRRRRLAWGARPLTSEARRKSPEGEVARRVMWRRTRRGW